jgi:hypothetical protein
MLPPRKSPTQLLQSYSFSMVFESRSLKQRFQDHGKSENVSAAVFLLTVVNSIRLDIDF